ncbi:MAG: hypothetical protein CMP08_03375 [Xanthomonadales bacterium]|nr:hypothetical protein [Xanthomonadales bacterium]
MARYDWLVIGAGPQGRFVATAVRAADPSLALALVDPEPPMQAWHRRAAATGMRYLRSSNAHHLGRHRRSLLHFSQSAGYDARHLLGYYKRPSLALFNALAEAELAGMHQIHQRALRVTPDSDAWQVVLDNGTTTTARHVVLATGPEQPYRPPGLGACEHVFDTDFHLGAPGRATVIVGGGITGAQLALRACEAGHRVAWLTRHTPQACDFDSEPRYAGPLGMRPFLDAPVARRTGLLAQARRPGTLPPDVHADITARLAAGALDWIHGEPVACDDDTLRLADGRVLAAERVILATGFESEPGVDSLLAQVLADTGAQTDGQGHVPLDADLQITAGLHVVGRAASLSLGPMAGNIKGARWAGECLAAVARNELAERV